MWLMMKCGNPRICQTSLWFWRLRRIFPKAALFIEHRYAVTPRIVTAAFGCTASWHGAAGFMSLDRSSRLHLPLKPSQRRIFALEPALVRRIVTEI